MKQTLRWSETELQFLHDNYKTMSDAKLSVALNRTESAIAERRKKLRLLRDNKKAPKDTRCWTCVKAYGDCSWSAAFKPVHGWNAIPALTRKHRGGYEEGSFTVLYCPEYIKEPPRKPLF